MNLNVIMAGVTYQQADHSQLAERHRPPAAGRSIAYLNDAAE
ncbi:hypothetical protein [Paraburkholderia phenazinium]|jgi:hypothetical protein|nr:hypothetical protein [Paraburkholderia phenazinium]